VEKNILAIYVVICIKKANESRTVPTIGFKIFIKFKKKIKVFIFLNMDDNNLIIFKIFFFEF
jgi:hypothetical protein